MATIEVPSSLRKLTSGQSTVKVNAGNILEAFNCLKNIHPNLFGEIIKGEKDIPAFINIYLDGENIRYLDGVETAVQPQSRISIQVALAGG